jgi:hypothetical protein
MRLPVWSLKLSCWRSQPCSMAPCFPGPGAPRRSAPLVPVPNLCSAVALRR